MPEKIRRSIVQSLKKKYDMEDTPDLEFVEWFRRNHGTGYALEIIEDPTEMKYCAYCKKQTAHSVVTASTDGYGTGRDLRCTVCGSSRMGEIQGFDASLM